jgi:hypothetical protein
MFFTYMYRVTAMAAARRARDDQDMARLMGYLGALR